MDELILLLFSNKRAYDKGTFSKNIQCPTALETIEVYIQILMPSYFVTLGWEKNGSSIACVIPSVLYMINAWDKMEITEPKAKELCYSLIQFVKEKFKFELVPFCLVILFCFSWTYNMSLFFSYLLVEIWAFLPLGLFNPLVSLSIY